MIDCSHEYALTVIAADHMHPSTRWCPQCGSLFYAHLLECRLRSWSKRHVWIAPNLRRVGVRAMRRNP